MVSTCISLMTNDVEHLFMFSLAMFCLLCISLKLVCFPKFLRVLLCILDTSPLLGIYFAKVYSQFLVVVFFFFSTVSVKEQMFLMCVTCNLNYYSEGHLKIFVSPRNFYT